MDCLSGNPVPMTLSEVTRHLCVSFHSLDCCLGSPICINGIHKINHPNSDDMGLRNCPNKLIKDILSGNCIAFVGAGFSITSGLPSWYKVLVDLAERARATDLHPISSDVHQQLTELINRGDAKSYDMVTQMLEDHFEDQPNWLADQLTQLLHPRDPVTKDPMPDGKLPEAQQKRLRQLLGMPFRAIITTNFDIILEGRGSDGRDVVTPQSAEIGQIYRDILTPGKTIANYWEGIFNEKQMCPIIQIHGSVKKPESIVFSTAGYRRLLHGDAKYKTFLRSAMSTCTLLYVGSSLQDMYIYELRSEIMAMHMGKKPVSVGDVNPFDDADAGAMAYAIVPDKKAADLAYYLRHEGVCMLTWDTLWQHKMKQREALDSKYEQAKAAHSQLRIKLHGRMSETFESVDHFLNRMEDFDQNFETVHGAVVKSLTGNDQTEVSAAISQRTKLIRELRDFLQSPPHLDKQNVVKDFGGLDHYLTAIHNLANPLHRLGCLLARKKIVWLDRPEMTDDVRRVIEILKESSEFSGHGECNITRVSSVRAALDEACDAAFIICHYGSPVPIGPAGHVQDRSLEAPAAGPVCRAAQLLKALQTHDGRRCPVFVVTKPENLPTKAKTLAPFGVTELHTSYSGLLRGIARTMPLLHYSAL
eukprot:TRINITY_DN1955_c0_g1_i1.p1 TRINITY_DN1955_c0_g1~~TRINITY_DN1955_c0_g1_i1.p1  ORF type:complete len:645 (-),score=30.03 TRINITY_DN1955_c0_g1_i1:58-1992(-)